ncbi:carbohydrate ABC transporter permease [Pontibacillus yanchengensis]|uniref:Sugar ABC transporter permease n=1 Tax=Pontibacillus yanchengensis Y32 TaxID=1385514 RepID=A0A0A2TIM1_9BACI|nr:carbohydrate ABC transporter permease [Pontibacillus yanchengensis]KGP74298.1 sugar ABC transporter permease [Pontibacillus yanchengensis Y32]
MVNTNNRRTILYMVLGILATCIMMFPVYWMFITSIKPLNEIFSSPPIFFPNDPTFKPYIEIFQGEKSMLLYMKNSFIIGSGSMLLTLLLSAPAAYALARKKITGLVIIVGVLITSQMFPTIIMATPLYIIYQKIGLTDTFLGLIIANTTVLLPFAIILLRPFFLRLPKGLEEAALIDGCNKFTTFFKVILPLTRTGLITVGTFTFLMAWNELLFALTLSNDNSMRPVTVGIFNYMGEYQSVWNNLMAASFVSSLPIVIAFIFLQKYIVDGLTTGATKG